MNLRRILLVDAATCVVTGLALALFATPLASRLGLPQPLLFYAGLALLPAAALMAWVAARTTVPVSGAWVVVAGNALWALASVALLFFLSPRPLGYAFVIAQAVAVAVLAELEYVGLRRSAA